MTENKSLPLVHLPNGTGGTSKSTRRIGGGLASRVAAVANRPPQMHLDAATFPNRIALMLDLSGSMASHINGKKKVDHLRDAVLGFVGDCDLTTTGVSITSFPMAEDGYSGNGIAMPLEANYSILQMAIMGMQSGGGTPMAAAMEFVFHTVPLTRGVIVSDGEADNPDGALAQADAFHESRTIIDTVHIGDEPSGEELLKEIARRTGGLFIKFTDVANFGKNFKYLTPGNRTLLLESGAAQLLGAKEVK